VAELEAVLDALGTDAAERVLVFARIEAPRALRHLRQSADPDLGAPPTAGDLLRAMRLRKGWTQEQEAAQVGVVRTAVAHWERGDRLPSTEQIQTLCYALGAQEEELLALTTGAFTAAPAEAPVTWEEEEGDLWRRLQAIRFGQWHGLDELRYLALQREAWGWALREPAARPLLARAYASHAQLYRNEERWGEIGALAQRALAAFPQPDPGSGDYLWAVILNATAAAYGGPRPAPMHGFQLLQAWVERSALPEYTAWMLSDTAKYLAQAGQTEASLLLAQQACRPAESCHPVELVMRRVDYGELLLEAGYLEEALRVLPGPMLLGEADSLDLLLVLAEVHRQAGNQAEAEACLQQAIDLTAAHSLDCRHRKVDAVAQRF
jgi:transcriptional regulator with XRE-family HTH domain